MLTQHLTGRTAFAAFALIACTALPATALANEHDHHDEHEHEHEHHAHAQDKRVNPAISLVLNGTYTNLSKDPAQWQISGFVPGGEEVGPGSRGFSLGESELTLSAHIDNWLYGALTVAVTPEDEIETEEAFIETTALPGGLRLKAGRFLGAVGHLNAQHAHTWDFVDAPLTHQAFFGGHYRQEGVQGTWRLPTERFIELGAELGRGSSFPGHDEGSRNGAGAITLTAHTGGELGHSHSWRAGASWLQTRAQDRPWETTDAFDTEVSNAFTGRSRMWVLDGVWKWAPHGHRGRSFKLQGEYFRRVESGELNYDLDGASAGPLSDAYRSRQSGWYLQGVYQFAPGWRVGLRQDRLDPGTVKLAGNSDNLLASQHAPRRSSVMLDWGPAENQRWRLQLSRDHAQEGVKDTQVYLQYQVNLGALRAHSH